MASNERGCVLIVDDEQDIRQSLRDVVELIGCTAFLAASAEEALMHLENHRPCLILLDLLMPGMGGAKMLETMQSAPELASIRVVVSTSSPEKAPKNIPLLPKPIDIDALHRWLQLHCQCD